LFRDLLKDKELAPFAELAKRGETILLEEVWEGPKALLIELLRQATGKRVWVITGSARESRLYSDLPAFTSAPILEFPAWDTLPSEEISPSLDISGERFDILRRLLESEEKPIVISSLPAALQAVVPPHRLQELLGEIRVGAALPFDQFLEELGAKGYRRCPVAADKGEFAVRGGIIDLFPIDSPDPYRIEFWGDEVDSIRLYDPVGQKSIHQVDSFRLTPAYEWELLRQERALLVDYLEGETVVLFDDLLLLEDRYASIGRGGPLVASFSELLERIEGWQKIYMAESPIEQFGEVTEVGERLKFPLFDRELIATRWRHPFFEVADLLEGDDLLQVARSASERKLQIHYLCEGESEEERLRAMVDIGNASIHRLYLSSGFVLPKSEIAVIPMTEFTHRYKIRRQKLRSTYHTLPSEFTELGQGDLVVHLNSGIGRYQGVEWHKNHEGVGTEFMAIEYAKGNRLLVPLTQSHLVNRYIGAGEEQPTSSALGGTRWKAVRQATERAIRDYAADLLEVYAERQVVEGFACPPDSEETELFEREFPYVETEDQLRAIADVKGDLVGKRPMDRLICGDVGYGKTEVAMRAAFKMVVDGGKQVAILVPTTVLGLQHYETFCERLNGWPIRIELVSRFRKPAQVREAIEGAAVGSVDILIGTHRIIGKDVQFKDLGLVIIDEEQRFGVRTKEKLRNFKRSVDCLTLSATPIPRTLYMSVVGARDMSVIATPPQDRLPIQTIVCEVEEQKIKGALERELARGGQVYFIHNRVEGLTRWSERLRKLVPQARILIAHGQLSADEIDQVFHLFKSGEADILVATTIVESGVDIPNANTILIDRADTFGMADLYQLRGRVGRWNRRAYCYFLVPRQRELSEEARQRLSAMVEVSGYGGGMKVAMRDLEIRGAGNILGTQQSGHVSAIGFHLYCKLLKRMIGQLQGKIPAQIAETKLEFPQQGMLPESYIAEPKLRMEIYQRFGEAISVEEVDRVMEEVRDRFGRPPEPVEWLYRLMRIRVVASLKKIDLLKMQKVSLSAERQTGGQPEVRSCLIAQPKNPEDLERKVVMALEKMFA
jgi:transcription-repair coupling factor (superfamily II helicase)